MEKKQKVKVLQVFASLNMGGAESRMMDVYRHLDRSRCEFEFLVMQTDEQFYEKEVLAMGGVIYKISSPRSVGIFEHIRQLRKCMRRGAYDAVHVHTSYHCGIAVFAAWLEHIPVRISHARTTGSKQKNGKGLMLTIGKLLIRLFSTHRLAISAEAGRYLFDNSPFEVVPNAIDIAKYQRISTKAEKAEIRKSLGLPTDAFVIGQIGRFDPMKNHVFTLRWFAQFIHKSENAWLMLIGEGGLRREMEDLAVSLGVSDRVLFTGVRGDVPTVIHAIDVLFFPSVFEGLGGVVLEAQAAGVPTVESDSVPEATDLGIGLVERRSLAASMETWNSAIRHSGDKQIPDYDTIKAYFHRHKYSLEYELDMFMRVYRDF